MHTHHRAIRPVLLIASLAPLTACSPPRADHRQPPPITTGLNALASDDTPASTPTPTDPVSAEPDAWEQAALDLQAVLNEQTPPAQLDPPAEPQAQQPLDTPPDESPSQPTSDATPPPEQAHSSEADPQHQDQPSADRTTPTATTTQPADDARQLADRLTAQAPTSDTPATDLIRATILANLWPHPPTNAPTAIALSPSERARLSAAAALTNALASPDTDTPALLDAIDRARTDLIADGSGFVIAHADLARRVEGFGKYTPFPAHTFLAGKPNRMIVYTEPANFGHRPRTASDRTGSPDANFVVDLSQELTLYHEASPDLQAWHQPKARIVDASRNRQRDYYLINEIILPANLSVGSYRLKITTRDETTGATAQTAIPIDIVADPALAYGNR